MSKQANINRIRAVYNALGAFRDSVVFVGGATVALYSDREAEDARPTDDVDIVVEIWSRAEYAKLEEQLRSIGFQPDTSSPSICRFRVQGIVVDIMRTQEEEPEDIQVDIMATQNVLGFYNIWYPDGFAHSIKYEIDEWHTVRIFSAPYFIASKIEAFKSRGGNDGRMSHDFEDMVYLMENRATLWNEIANAENAVRLYLTEWFGHLLKQPYTEEWISANVSDGSTRLTERIIMQMRELVN